MPPGSYFDTTSLFRNKCHCTLKPHLMHVGVYEDLKGPSSHGDVGSRSGDGEDIVESLLPHIMCVDCLHQIATGHCYHWCIHSELKLPRTQLWVGVHARKPESRGNYHLITFTKRRKTDENVKTDVIMGLKWWTYFVCRTTSCVALWFVIYEIMHKLWQLCLYCLYRCCLLVFCWNNGTCEPTFSAGLISKFLKLNLRQYSELLFMLNRIVPPF